MPGFIRTPFLGHDIALWLPDPNWSAAPEITYTLATRSEQALSGRQNRRPKHLALRHAITARWTLPRATAAAWQEGAFALGTAYIAIPIPCDQLAWMDWPERIHNAEFVLNYDGADSFSILASSALVAPPPLPFLAPLFVGKIDGDERPTVTALNDYECEFSMQLVEKSPWDFRITPAPPAATLTDQWPATLSPNWRTLPEDSITDMITQEEVGAGRLAAIDGQEGQPYRTQKFLLTLENREQIRTLLKFFESRLGSVRSWTIPWLLQPSETDTPATPHTTRVHFSEDTLKLKYITDELAEATLQVAQLPWEIEIFPGEAPEQQPEAHFFHFFAREPAGIDWRYTDWEHDLARNESGSSVTYLGDVYSLFEYDQITRTLDLSDEPLTLNSWVMDGNPLMLIAQRAIDVPINLVIRKGSPNNPDAARIIYSGRIDEVTVEGRAITAKTSVLGGLLDVKVPNFYFGPICNHGFCRPGCFLSPAAWTFPARIESIDGATIEVTLLANPPSATVGSGFFARGWLSTGYGLAYELRQIVNSLELSNGRHRITLKRALRHAVPGLDASLRPHCSGTANECVRYGNYINFGGHPHISGRNLSLPTREVAPAGGKK